VDFILRCGNPAVVGHVQTVEVAPKISRKRSHGRIKVAVAFDSRRRHQRTAIAATPAITIRGDEGLPAAP
jgi:hypothetical protein